MRSSIAADDFITRVGELEGQSKKARLERDAILRRIQSSAGTDEQTALFAAQRLGRRGIKRVSMIVFIVLSSFVTSTFR